MKIKTAFLSGGEKHTSVWWRRVVDRLAVRWGAAGGVGVETGNSFSTYNPTPPLHPVRHYRLIGLPPRHSPPPPPHHRPRTCPYPPLHRRRCSPRRVSDYNRRLDFRLHTTTTTTTVYAKWCTVVMCVRACICACAPVRTCHRHDSITVYLLNPPHRPIDWNSPVASS